LDNHREWYRYHHLFAELLRQRLKESLPAGQIALLYQAASVWCEEHGEVFEALSYARQVPDETRVATLLMKFAIWFFVNSKLPEFYESRPHCHQLAEANLAMYGAAWASLAPQSPKQRPRGIEQHFA
jgi:ATP/maltotriose-dependent transcriptional regulator MalT